MLIAGTDQMAFFASYLRHLLMLLDLRAEIVASPSQEALGRLSRIDEQTLVVGLSAGRPHPLITRTMKLARHRKAPTLAITDATLSEVARLARIRLYYSSNTPAFVRSHTALLSLIQALAYGVYARDAAAVRRADQGVPAEVAPVSARAATSSACVARPTRPRASYSTLSAAPIPSGRDRVCDSRPIHSPTGCALDVQREVRVDEQVLVPRQHVADPVAEVAGRGEALQRRGSLSGDDRRRRRNQAVDGPRAEGAGDEADLDRVGGEHRAEAGCRSRCAARLRARAAAAACGAGRRRLGATRSARARTTSTPSAGDRRLEQLHPPARADDLAPHRPARRSAPGARTRR